MDKTDLKIKDLEKQLNQLLIRAARTEAENKTLKSRLIRVELDLKAVQHNVAALTRAISKGQ